MKLAVPSTRPDLDGAVASRLGTARHLLVIETDDMSFEVLDGPPRSSGPGAGVMAVSLVVNMGARVILVGHVASHIVDALKKQGIDVVTEVTGTVADAVDDYVRACSVATGSEEDGQTGDGSACKDVFSRKNRVWTDALKKGLRQFYTLLPRLVGVVLVLGLIRGFVSQELLFSLFPGNMFFDPLWGGVLGSVLAGNAVNSYVIAKGLLGAGVGLSAVTALMLAWVGVGVVQLPAESAALGACFAVVRNLAGFVMAVVLSFVVLFLPGGGI
ncbi:NifB/NifX family molybdenum-iron cluster-binding protein [Desulfoplanes sp.]